MYSERIYVLAPTEQKMYDGKALLWRCNGSCVAVKWCKNSRDYRTRWRRSSPTKQEERKSLIIGPTLLICRRWDSSTALSSCAPRLTVNDYCPYTAARFLSSLFSQHQQVVRILLWRLRPGEKKKRLDSTKWWATFKKKNRRNPCPLWIFPSREMKY